jgi:hypothetical protein
MNFFIKHKKLSIFLAVLIFFLFYKVIPEIRGDKVFLLTRLFYSHPELADKIVVKAYVLSDEQVGELFLYPEKEPVLLQNGVFGVWEKGGIPPPHLNLVLRIQKRGPWVGGIIQYNINDGEVIGKINAQDLGIAGGKQTDFQNFVVPLGATAISLGKDPEGYPEITYKWRELYGSW